MRPTDVVDGLRDLTERMTTVPRFRAVIEASAKMDLDALQDGQVARMLTKGGPECFQVTASMVPLVQLAAESLDTSDTFRLDFAPANDGFVQFETPLKITDIREQTMHVSWLRWGSVAWEADDRPAYGRGLWCVAFADASQPDDVALTIKADSRVPEELLQDLGRWRWSGINVVRDGSRLSLMTEADRAHALAVQDHGAERDEQYESSDQQVPRFLKALWLLMAQSVGEVSARPLDRAGTKRARRLNLPTSVTVVELRRPKGLHLGEQGEGGREYGYRWLVKGHFAWRACSEHHPLAEPYEKGWRARIWISPYAKNADREDLPWKMGEKVYVLNR